MPTTQQPDPRMIVGHQHDRFYREGVYATADCRACGQPVVAHKSWGRSVADRIGGNWRDYVNTVDVRP